MFRVRRTGKRPDPPEVFVPIPNIADDHQSRACVAEIRVAAEAIRRAGSTRVEFVRDTEIDGLDDGAGGGPITRGMRKFVGQMSHSVAEGVVDLAGDRLMLDFGAYAESTIGEQEFAGYSGGPLRARDEGLGSKLDREPTPQWMIALLDRAVRATATGEDDIDEIPCRRFDVLADLTSPTPAANERRWTPDWPDLARVPITVWLEGSSVRRLRYRELARTTYTLSLRDPGIDLAGLDWDRLGTFRTAQPKHGAEPNVL